MAKMFSKLIHVYFIKVESKQRLGTTKWGLPQLSWQKKLFIFVTKNLYSTFTVFPKSNYLLVKDYLWTRHDVHFCFARGQTGFRFPSNLACSKTDSGLSTNQNLTKVGFQFAGIFWLPFPKLECEQNGNVKVKVTLAKKFNDILFL